MNDVSDPVTTPEFWLVQHGWALLWTVALAACSLGLHLGSVADIFLDGYVAAILGTASASFLALYRWPASDFLRNVAVAATALGSFSRAAQIVFAPGVMSGTRLVGAGIWCLCVCGTVITAELTRPFARRR